MSDLDAVFMAYDIRGTVPDQLDDDLFQHIGAAFARFAQDDDPSVTRILVGRDMRPSGEHLWKAMARGIQGQGIDVVDLGLAATDLVFYASGALDAPAAMLTASHNPAEYNGAKLCLSGARAIGEDSGLQTIRGYTEKGLEPIGTSEGSLRAADLLDDFVRHVHTFVDVGALAPLKIVADTANGMGGLTLPAVFAGLPFDIEILYGDLDGTFPNHPADPIQPANQVDLKHRVLEVGADIGLATDGDADRVFLVDERAEGLSGSTTTAIVAAAMLERDPGAVILHNLICSKSVPEVVRERGGTPIRTRVGHSLIKKIMADTGAAFGGEHSGHYYFRDNFRADSGVIAALVILEQMSRTGLPLSQLRLPFERYAGSGEINFRVDDPATRIDDVAIAYSHADQDRLDGLTVDLGDWWFNLRPSNTEPLLRLNLEAADQRAVEAHVEDLTQLIQGDAHGA